MAGVLEEQEREQGQDQEQEQEQPGLVVLGEPEEEAG